MGDNLRVRGKVRATTSNSVDLPELGRRDKKDSSRRPISGRALPKKLPAQLERGSNTSRPCKSTRNSMSRNKEVFSFSGQQQCPRFLIPSLGYRPGTRVLVLRRFVVAAIDQTRDDAPCAKNVITHKPGGALRNNARYSRCAQLCAQVDVRSYAAPPAQGTTGRPGDRRPARQSRLAFWGFAL